MIYKEGDPEPLNACESGAVNSVSAPLYIVKTGLIDNHAKIIDLQGRVLISVNGLKETRAFLSSYSPKNALIVLYQNGHSVKVCNLK